MYQQSSFYCWVLFHCLNVYLLISSPVDRQLDCLKFGIIMTNVTMTLKYRFWPKSGFAWLYDNCMLYFIRNCQTIFQSTVLHARPPEMYEMALNSHQHFISSAIFTLAIWVDMHWCFTVFFNVCFLNANDVKHVYMYLFASLISILMKPCWLLIFTLKVLFIHVNQV